MFSPTRPTRVLLADDECLFRTSLRQLLEAPAAVIQDVYGVDVGAGFEVAGEAATGEETVRIARTVKADLLLLDLNMPRLSGLDALRELADDRSRPRTILLTGAISPEHALRAVRLGVDGVVVKHAATELLFACMTAVMAGRCWIDRSLLSDLVEVARPLFAGGPGSAADRSRLTPREQEVLQLVASGCGNKEIARRCSLSEDTVKHHLTRLFDKTGVANRLELARCFVPPAR